MTLENLKAMSLDEFVGLDAVEVEAHEFGGAAISFGFDLDSHREVVRVKIDEDALSEVDPDDFWDSEALAPYFQELKDLAIEELSEWED